MSNWKHYQNGNYTVSLNLNDGTKIRRTDDDVFKAEFAENIDIKICDYCDVGCRWCHEGSTTSGGFGDLEAKFLETLHPYQELAIGGGDATAHPYLIPFLQKLKAKNIIANLTVNQIHFMDKQDLIRSLVNDGLIYGLGVSLMTPTQAFLDLVATYNNIVIHTINGSFNQSHLDMMPNRNLKLLILGYKDLRRGIDFKASAVDSIHNNQKWLRDEIKNLTKLFQVVSFDNLALEQLNVKELISEEEWNQFYMGPDGSSTFYIDMVNKQYSLSSTSALHERFDLLDSVDDMFNHIQQLPRNEI